MKNYSWLRFYTTPRSKCIYPANNPKERPMARFLLTITVLLLLPLAGELRAQIACPFAMPREDKIFSTWEKAPLLLVKNECMCMYCIL